MLSKTKESNNKQKEGDAKALDKKIDTAQFATHSGTGTMSHFRTDQGKNFGQIKQNAAIVEDKENTAAEEAEFI